MKHALSSTARRLSAGVIGCALVASGAVFTGPAHALAGPVDATTPTCVAGAPHASVASRRVRDTPKVPAVVRQQVDAQLASAAEDQAAPVQGRTAGALPVYRVLVQIHIIHGRHRHERKVKPAGARRLFGILQGGYNGAQSSASEHMGVIFDLKRITITRNDRWYHANPMTRADKQMKRRLHRGTATTLNIYIKSFRTSGGNILLGYSRFPWQYAHSAKLDGVEVNVDGLPGGRATGYNLGDTVVHETGHWLGLFHTFQGDACEAINDGVADTPAESGPAASCTDTTNVCDPTDLLPAPAGPGYFNPAFNFMEYTPDPCMRMFTAGQHARFAGLYRQFRFGR